VVLRHSIINILTTRIIIKHTPPRARGRDVPPPPPTSIRTITHTMFPCFWNFWSWWVYNIDNTIIYDAADLGGVFATRCHEPILDTRNALCHTRARPQFVFSRHCPMDGLGTNQNDLFKVALIWTPKIYCTMFICHVQLNNNGLLLYFISYDI